MNRRIAVLAALSALAPAPAMAQRLADRVATVREGTVTFTYDTRPEVCGHGRTIIIRSPESGSGMMVFSPDGGISIGEWNGTLPTCIPGPAQVRLTIRDHRVVTLRPSVRAAAAGSPGGRDFGAVATQVAADFLIDLARTASEEVCANALLAAALADSVRIAPQLLAFARDRSLRPTNREQAVKWLARAARWEDNDAADEGIRAIAADQSDDLTVRERAIRVVVHPAGDAFLRDLYRRLTQPQLKDRVIRALGESPGSANLVWLERVVLDDGESLELRDRAIRALGEAHQESDRLRALYPRLRHAELKDRVLRVVGEESSVAAMRWIESVAENGAEPLELRDRALRVMGEQGDLAYLRQAHVRLDHPELRDRVLRALGEAGGGDNLRLLRAVAVDTREATELRDRALRALAEAGVRTADLAALYDAIANRELRERLIKLLAERGDQAARDKLAEIARTDPDAELRSRALRRLAESGDPRGRSS